MGRISELNILIVGAGPVGLAAAIELSRRGGKLRIIDSNAEPNPNSRALAVNARTLKLLGPCGATERLIAKGSKQKRVVFRQDSRILGQIDFDQMPGDFNFLLSLAQHETETILASLLAEQGINVERNLAVVAVADGTVTLANGENLHPDILIGADGAHSVVRKSLGLTFAEEAEASAFGLADVTLEDWPFDFHTVVLTLLDSHIVPFIPLGENFGRMITTKPDCLHNLPADAKVKSVTWETDFKISYRQAETYQNGNAFIIGDAAHIHSPVGGRGMNLGIEDACWLAYLLDQGREAEFTALRHPVGTYTLQFTSRLTRMALVPAWQRNLALKIALPVINYVPGLRRKLLGILSAADTPPPEWLP
jgi:2-polyprenyl-6-methoxyphenol hydroxylase-like FAD-dependent oxidoreductase